MASSGRLGAGETGRISAKVDTTGRQGRLIKTVEVMSNDPQRPRVILTLRATVLAPPPSAPRSSE